MTETYSPGLEGVIAGETAISTVDSRPAPIAAIRSKTWPRNSHFEEVAYLLLHGELPTAEQAGRVSRAAGRGVRTCRRRSSRRCARFPPARRRWTCCARPRSLLAHWDPEVADNSHDANVRKAERLLAQLPVVVAARQRLKQGKEPVAADPGRSLAGQFPVDAPRREAQRQAGAGDGRLADPVRRARVQRLDVRGPRRRFDAVRPALGASPPRSARSKGRCTAARTKRVDGRAAGSRRAGQGRSLDSRRPGRQEKGSWASATASTKTATRGPCILKTLAATVAAETGNEDMEADGRHHRDDRLAARRSCRRTSIGPAPGCTTTWACRSTSTRRCSSSPASSAGAPTSSSSSTTTA